jgi:hypothetical protein
VTQVVQRPFVEHLVQRDLPGLLVQRHSAAGLGRQIAQVRDVGFALLLEVVDGILREFPFSRDSGPSRSRHRFASAAPVAAAQR